VPLQRSTFTTHRNVKSGLFFFLFQAYLFLVARVTFVKMTEPSSSQPNAFYSACCDNDLKRVQETVKPSEVNQIDIDGNTALHIASSRGYIELVQFLLRYHVSRKIRNNDGFTAEEVASSEEIKDIFKATFRPMSDSKHFVAATSDVEWLDNYKNAYRISYENNEHMKRWLLKVPLEKLLNELDSGYIDKIQFSNEAGKQIIKAYIQAAIDWENPVGLIKAYTSAGNGFYRILNRDLAEIGSNFRFLSTQNLFNSGYLDNEAPKDLGQHIFAAILINYPGFRSYYHTGTVYRGMNITPSDLEEYKTDNIVMTRSFLSTSEERIIPELFIRFDDCDNHLPVMCIYKVSNPRSSLAIKDISCISGENEVLIVPFVVFQVKKQRNVETIRENERYRLIEIELEECNSNLA
jgi:hypothetical protein